MVAEYYFSSPEPTDTQMPFYTKWRLAKRSDKYFGTRHLSGLVTRHIQLPVIQEVYNVLQEVSYNVELKKLHKDDTPCLASRQSTLKLVAPTSENQQRSVLEITRWFPCMECQRYQECSMCPIEMVYSPGGFATFNVHHPFAIDLLGWDIQETPSIFYYSQLLIDYHPEWNNKFEIEATGDLNVTTEDFHEFFERYDIDWYLM